MNCPECDAAMERREKNVGVQIAVVYECRECAWTHTMYFDTLESETEVKS